MVRARSTAPANSPRGAQPRRSIPDARGERIGVELVSGVLAQRRDRLADAPVAVRRHGVLRSAARAAPSARGERLVRADDFAAQREQRDRDELEVGDADGIQIIVMRRRYR